ncbi:MAG: FtsX-like permease family protein [Chitinophagaceae bacterium]
MLDHFKTAIRFLWKRKSFAFLNVFGLSVGIAASLLIFLVIKNELSYDRYHKDADRIHRLVTRTSNRTSGELIDYSTGIPIPLSAAMRQEFPEIKTGVIANLSQAQVYVPGLVSGEEKRFKENDGLFFAEAQFFDIFQFEWLVGNASRLNEPNTVVLQESYARRFFGSADAAIGRRVEIWSFRIPLQVVGVYKDVPSNSDLPVQFGASFPTLIKLFSQDGDPMTMWDQSMDNLTCYLYAPSAVNIRSVQQRLPAFIKKYYQDKPEVSRSLIIQPLSAVHFDQDIRTYTPGRLSKKELWSLGLIGGFLLLVACINFINLSTAQSVNRAKEIGVRKVLGSDRNRLILQFLRETAVITVFALLLGLALAAISLPLINQLMYKDLALDLLHQPMIWAFLLITGGLVTLLAGFYPALVLSAFRPMQIFKNKVNGRSNAGVYLRRSLVVFQFVVAQLLIIGTIVVVKQMHYFRNKPTGMDKDGIVMVNLPSDSTLRIKYPLLKSRIEAIRGVEATSLCMEAASSFSQYQEDLYFQGEPIKRDFRVTRQLADTGFFRTFGIQLVSGRIPFASDTTVELVVNEMLVSKLGFRDNNEMVGKLLSFDGNRKYMVVGVCKDFNNLSLRQALTPLVISSESSTYEWIVIRTERERMQATLEKVRTTFSSIYPTYMYDQVYFDERLELYYENEVRISQLFKVFAGLAILISCLGLYGLISFMTVQKTREVGIRKVLGASVQSIMYLFSREFTWLILTAFVIAAPIGYYLMNQWLAGFYYHISLGWMIFFLSIFLSLVLAWITVGYKAFRAAVVNPVKSLKSE